MPESDLLPELDAIRRCVLECLPEGFHLDGVELNVGDLDVGLPPAFTALITISEDADAECYGLSHDISSRIREMWPKDVLYIKTEYRSRQSLN